MINKKTVLILGAGASMPYGFPSGSDLMSRICEEFHEVSSPALKHFLANKGITQDDAREFRDALFFSGRESVDAFLEHRPEFLEIGKIAIAAMLIPCERKINLFGAKSNWYHTLFTVLNASFSNFAKNQLSVLTFNYDRSLEYYLLTSLSNSFGKKPEECAEVLAQVPIIHLHGKLGELEGLGSHKEARPFEDFDSERMEYNSRMLQLCVDKIRIIHEGVGSEPQFALAKKLLAEAQVVCFLGFGYHQTNLDRLFPLGVKPTYYGTAYGKLNAERTWIERYFVETITLGKKSEDISTFLREYPILIQDPQPWIDKLEGDQWAKDIANDMVANLLRKRNTHLRGEQPPSPRTRSPERRKER